MTLDYDDRPVGQCDFDEKADQDHDDAALDAMTPTELAARGERRIRERTLATGQYAAHVIRLGNELALCQAQVDVLLQEKERLLEIIHHQGVLIQHSEPST